MRSSAGAANAALARAFERDRRHVWGLCYRMTGSGADADALVQDTWLRALEHPPRDLERELRPWLRRVALNASRDALRRRRRREYAGSWLPTPAPDEALAPDEIADESRRPDTAYGLAESATQAFLLALEALTPAQRAVLLLRDVYGASVRETAAAMGTSEPNVKTTLHRARRRLAAYDASPCRPTPELCERVRGLLEAFALAVAASDPARIASLLREDAELWSDSNGEFLSNPRPLRGASAIARFYAARSRALGPPPFVELVRFNALPGALIAFGPLDDARLARRLALAVVPGPDGRIARLHNIMATPKLAPLTHRFPTLL